MRKVFALVMSLVLCVCSTAYGEQLPEIYYKSFLDLQIGDSFILAESLEVTVDDINLTTYSELYQTDIEGTPQADRVMAIDMTSTNVGTSAISGNELSEGLMPYAFMFPSNLVEEENNSDDPWGDWESMLSAFENDPRSEANVKTYGIRILESAKDWYSLNLLQEIQVAPGATLQIRDLRGSISPSRIQFLWLPIAYEVTFSGDAERVMLQEFSVDFNDPECFIGDNFASIDVLLSVPMNSEYELIEKYRKIWGPLKGREMYLELTRAWQEVFGMEVTGVLDQELLCRLIHYNITHD